MGLWIWVMCCTVIWHQGLMLEVDSVLLKVEAEVVKTILAQVGRHLHFPITTTRLLHGLDI